MGEELDWGVIVALRRERVPRVGVNELGEGGVDEAWAGAGHGSDAGSCAPSVWTTHLFGGRSRPRRA